MSKSVPPIDIRAGERWTDDDGIIWELTDRGQWSRIKISLADEDRRQQAMHDALLRISQMRALLDQTDSDTLKVAIALADEALREAT